MARRTKEQAEATRERILDAAERVFLEKGVSSASLEGIARRAGVTRGAIYWHFRDKSDVLEAMLDRVRLPLTELADAERQKTDYDPLKLVRELCPLVLHKLRDEEHYRNIHSIIFTRCEFVEGSNPRFERQNAIDGENLQNLTEDFERAEAMGMLKPGVMPRVAALGLFSLMHGIFLCWLREPKRFDIVEEGEAMLDLFMRGIEA